MSKKFSLEEMKEELDDMFNIHEGFMIDLCKILKLDYTTTNTEVVLKKVKELVEKQEKVDKFFDFD